MKIHVLSPRASSEHFVSKRSQVDKSNDSNQIQPSHAPSRPDNLISLSRRSFLASTLTLSTAGCACCAGVLHNPLPALANEYDYTTKDPEVWKGVCAKGKNQSPIDLPAATANSPPSPYGPITPHYPRFTQGTVSNPGNGTPQVNLPDGVATLSLGDTTTLKLLNYHFHIPSEHSFDGQHTPLEVHLVHKDVKTGEIVVIAVLCEVQGDRPNPCIEAALKTAPQQKGGEPQPLSTAINLLALLPRTRAIGTRHRPYVSYTGSLTTPPCSEGVKWCVMLDPLQVPAEQVLRLQYFAGGGSTLGFNARQQQAKGGRDVTYSA